MALTFSYKLVAASEDTTTAKIKGAKGKNASDFGTNSKGKGNKSNKAGRALNNDFAGTGADSIVNNTAGQSIEIYSTGTELDQARTYWLEVYASDSNAANTTLESIDLQLQFNKTYFSSVNNFQYSDAFDLMRQSDDSDYNSEYGLRFQQGSADNLKTKSGNGTSDGKGQGKGQGKKAGDAVDYDVLGTGIQLSSTEQFVGRIEVEVNDGSFDVGQTNAATTAGNTRVDAGAIGQFVKLTANLDETILVTDGPGDAKNTIKSLREYGSYSVIDGVGNDEGASTLSKPTVQFVTGDFASDVSTAFDNFKTVLDTSTGVGSDAEGNPLPVLSTNLVREGQALDGGQFTLTNVGQAGLTDIGMTWNESANTTGIDVTFDSATITHNVSDAVDETLAVTNNGNNTYHFGTGTYGNNAKSQLERGERDDVSGGVYDNSDSMTVKYSAVVTGDAGSVAKVDFDSLRMTASGESAFDVFGANSAVIKNVITYQGDVSYDGKVGMRDLAVLNEAKRADDANGDAAPNRDANADHLGGIDLADLKVLADDWGKSIWQTAGDTTWQGTGDAQITLAEVSLQNEGDATAEAFAGSANFLTEGNGSAQLQMALETANNVPILAVEESAYTA